MKSEPSLLIFDFADALDLIKNNEIHAKEYRDVYK